MAPTPHKTETPAWMREQSDPPAASPHTYLPAIHLQKSGKREATAPLLYPNKYSRRCRPIPRESAVCRLSVQMAPRDYLIPAHRLPFFWFRKPVLRSNKTFLDENSTPVPSSIGLQKNLPADGTLQTGPPSVANHCWYSSKSICQSPAGMASGPISIVSIFI